jgi:hypothetical protein
LVGRDRFRLVRLRGRDREVESESGRAEFDMGTGWRWEKVGGEVEEKVSVGELKTEKETIR